MLEIIKSLLWSPLTVILIAVVGTVLCIRTSFRALRNPKRLFKDTLFSNNKSSFEATCTALGGTIGVGNTIGVAGAIVEGGPSALLWMLIASLFGMVIKEAEIFLSVKYKPCGNEFSGPMYYIEKGIGSKKLARVWAFSCILTSLGMGNVSQSMAAISSIEGIIDGKRLFLCIILTLTVGVTVSLKLSEIKRIIGVIVPFVTVTFILSIVLILIINSKNIPYAISETFTSMIDLKSGCIGLKWSVITLAMRSGFSRGIFTNEAGLGSASIIHSSSNEASPEVQAKWGVLEVFIDTVVICSLTGVAILSCNYEGMAIESITQYVFISSLGKIGGIIYAVSMLFFALASIIAWFCYAQCAIKYLGGNNLFFTFLFIFATFCGGMLNARSVLIISDIFNAIMLITNLIALLLLTRQAKSN